MCASRIRRVFLLFPLFTLWFYHRTNHSNAVVFFHPRIIQANRSSFQRNLIFGLKSSGTRRERLDYRALCILACGTFLSGRMPIVTRGVESIHRGTDQLTPKCWVSRWNKDEMRNQKRGCKIAIRFATFTFHWAITNLSSFRVDPF